jgi:hypothetical protein
MELCRAPLGYAPGLEPEPADQHSTVIVLKPDPQENKAALQYWTGVCTGPVSLQVAPALMCSPALTGAAWSSRCWQASCTYHKSFTL